MLKANIKTFVAEYIRPRNHYVLCVVCSLHKFVKSLRQNFDIVRSVEASRHSNKDIFVFKELKYVWVRDDLVRGALQAPYNGLYELRRRSGKLFEVLAKVISMVISINHLKLAFVENEPDDCDESLSIIILY